jgi:hypothetical protein
MPAILEHQSSVWQSRRFVIQVRRDLGLQQQLLGTRTLFGVCVVARRAGFAVTPRLLLRRQALYGERFVGGYRRRFWREQLLCFIDVSSLRLLDLALRSHWRKGSSWQRLLWRGVFPVLVVVSVVLSLVRGWPF